jgi:hypothetical protein
MSTAISESVKIRETDLMLMVSGRPANIVRIRLAAVDRKSVGRPDRLGQIVFEPGYRRGSSAGTGASGVGGTSLTVMPPKPIRR